MTAGLSLMKNVLTPLAKNVLLPLGLSGTSTADAAIQKRFHGSCCTLDLALRITALIISNKEMDDIIKIVK